MTEQERLGEWGEGGQNRGRRGGRVSTLETFEKAAWRPTTIEVSESTYISRCRNLKFYKYI